MCVLPSMLVAALLVTTACTPVTQTTVVIEADAIVTAADPQVTVRIFRANDVNGMLDIPEREEIVPDEIGYPIRVAIVPRGNDASRRYRVEVTAVGGGQTWTTRAISGFIPGQRRELRMRLEDACRTVTCSEEQACRGGVCVDVFVDLSAADAGQLVDAATPPGTDAPVPTGTDGGMDASTETDAGECATGLFGTSFFGSACFE